MSAYHATSMYCTLSLNLLEPNLVLFNKVCVTVSYITLWMSQMAWSHQLTYFLILLYKVKTQRDIVKTS